MTATLIRPHETKLGSEARRLRLCLHLTRQEVADMADVSPEVVNCFEHNWPVSLDYKRRILKELWAEKIKK
jgi:transcriptional regulator with XRE-family HTH domain